jgi:class 3 adenylate cyclase
VRVGIDSGPVVAAVIGKRKFSYDIWGDVVNTASRMESHGVPGRIQVTEHVHDLLRDTYDFEYRGEIEVKGKGPMRTYFLEGRKSAAE